MNILVIDTGSSSMRGSLLNENGRCLFSSSFEYHMVTDSIGKCEMSPDIFSDALVYVCKNAVNYGTVSSNQIDALSLTSQRSSVMPLGKDNLPIGNIIMWHDKRATSICDNFNRNYGDYIYSICGTVMSPVMSAPKMCYIKKEMPDIYEKASKLIGIHDYLLLLLTGNLLTDTSLASRTCLLDIKQLKWSDDLLALFDIDKEKLCDLALPGDIAGNVSTKFSNLTGLPNVPVISAGGDQQCSILGQGLTSDGQIGATVGTGSYVSMVCDNPVFDKEQQVNLNAAITPGHWIIEASTLSSGIVYRWFSENFYFEKNQSNPYDVINNEIAIVPPGAGNILALPYLSGKGCPDWDPYAMGTICNFNLGTSRAQVARAMLEGIASEISECCGVLTSLANDNTTELSLCGGLTKYNVFNQMVSDMTGLSVFTYSVQETTVLGAWIATATTLGLFKTHTEAVSALPFYKERTYYHCSKTDALTYERINRARRLLYTSIPFKQISNILNGASNYEEK